METDLSFYSDYPEVLSNMKFMQNMKLVARLKEVYWKILSMALGRMLQVKLRVLSIGRA